MQAAIFDLDGTLLDSMHIWASVDTTFLERRNIIVPADYTEAVTPMTLHEAAIYTIERFNLSESVEELKQEWNRMVAEIYEHSVALKPYAREYLTALKQQGTRLAVATSLPKALYEPALRKHDLTHLFDAFCSTDEVGCGKRQPDVFLLAAKRLSTEPARCVVYEDLLEAIISAKQAGMKAYAVYDESSKATWNQITKIADGTIFDFREAALPDSGND